MAVRRLVESREVLHDQGERVPDQREVNFLMFEILVNGVNGGMKGVFLHVVLMYMKGWMRNKHDL